MRLWLAGTAAVFVLAAGPSAIARGDAPLTPQEQGWHDRWGLTIADRKLKDVELLKKARFSSRSREMVAAAREGDPIAWFVLRAAMNLRCNGGAKISRDDCYALYILMRRSFPKNVPFSSGAYAWTSFSPSSEGHNERAADVGKLFEYGIGGPKDYAVALFFYEMATWPGGQLGEGHYRLGLMYEQGLGTKADPAKAQKEFERAVDAKHPGAAYMLAGRAAKPGSPLAADLAYYLATAAEGGVVDAAYRLGKLYEDGKLSAKNPGARLYKWYHMAALKGHVRAITGVGKAYDNGWGVAADSAKAEDWYRRGALAGDPEGAYRLAMAYGRRSDWAGGLPWLRRAADGGYPGARDMLNTWRARGVREKTFGNALLGILEFVADVAVEMDRQQQAELAAQRAQETDYAAALYAQGYYSGTGSSGGGSSAGASLAASSTGSGGSSSDSSGGGSSAAGVTDDWNNVSGSTGGSTDWDNASGGGSASGGSASGGGSSGASVSGGSGSAASSAGGGSVAGYLVIEDSNPGWREKQAASQAAYEKSIRDGKDAHVKAQADADARRAADEAAWKKRRDAALIACHGSLEAAARAKASCQ